MRKTLIAVLLLGAASLGAAATREHIVSQKNKAFSVKAMKVKAGESVVFRNDDAFFHNIFSLSEGHSFDLGSFPRGESRKATFSKPGMIEVECAIHPEMKMVVQVEQ